MTAAIQRMRLADPVGVSPERLACRSVSAEQESVLRMQYALAIIRLVNGISDSAQKGTVAKSVASQAETAGAQAEGSSGSRAGHCLVVDSHPCQGEFLLINACSTTPAPVNSSTGQ